MVHDIPLVSVITFIGNHVLREDINTLFSRIFTIDFFQPFPEPQKANHGTMGGGLCISAWTWFKFV